MTEKELLEEYSKCMASPHYFATKWKKVYFYRFKTDLSEGLFNAVFRAKQKALKEPTLKFITLSELKLTGDGT